MTRIVLVGAGSVEFTRNLLGDILSFEALRDAELVLHDIDADRLRDGRADGRAGRPAPSAPTPTIDGAPRPAHGARGRRLRDRHDPGRRRAGDPDRLRHPGPLRPPVHDQRHDQRRRRAARPADDPGRARASPPTWPTSARTRCSSTTPTRWACSSARSTRRSGSRRSACATRSTGPSTASPSTWACRSRRSTRSRAASTTSPGSCGSSTAAATCTPTCEAFVDAGKVPDDDLVRADLFRRFGWYPTESSEHHAEYNPWFIPKGQVEPFHVPIGEYLSRVANNLDEYAETKRMLDAGEPFEIERSGEYAAVIINAIATGEPARIVGQRDERRRGADREPRRPTPASRCPALVDGLGVHPTPIGALPPQCAAYTRPAVDCQELTVRAALDEDRDLVYHAVMTDPIVQARLTLDEAWRMTDELIAAEGEWLPGVARRLGTRLDLGERQEEATHARDIPGPRRRGAALARRRSSRSSSRPAAARPRTIGAAAAPRPPRRARAAPAGSARVRRRRRAASAAGYSGPPATIKYSIWGDPQEIASQTAIAEAFHAANPNITVDVDVSDWDAYWDKLQTGLAGGAAPDVFAMDGPLFPDYQARDVLLDLKPLHRPRRVRPDPARRPGRRRLHDRRRRPVRPAARPEHDRPLLQQGHVRRGRDPVPRRHLGLGQAPRGRQAADQARRQRRRRPRPVGLLHRDRRTWRTSGSRPCGRTAATCSRRTASRPCSAPTRRPAASSSSRT